MTQKKESVIQEAERSVEGLTADVGKKIVRLARRIRDARTTKDVESFLENIRALLTDHAKKVETLAVQRHIEAIQAARTDTSSQSAPVSAAEWVGTANYPVQSGTSRPDSRRRLASVKREGCD